MTKFRKGDVVMIKATVDSEYEIDGNIRIRVGYNDLYAEVKDLKMLRPVIKIGDIVVHEHGDGGVVLATHDDGWCWIKVDGAGFASWHISTITRLDPEPVEPELFEVEPPPAPEEAA